MADEPELAIDDLGDGSDFGVTGEWWGAISQEEWEAWMLEQELRTLNAARAGANNDPSK